MVNNKIYFSLFLISVFFITNCKTASKNFSYKISTYSIENNTKTNQVYLSSYLISFNNYLFEFNVGVSTIDSIFSESNKSNRHYKYDTLSVFILDSKNRFFYEFDKFENDNKLLNSGMFSKKLSGMRLADTSQKLTKVLYEKKMHDTILWNTKLHYIIDIQKNLKNKDSVNAFIFYLKNKNFTSLYDLMSAKYNDEYSMIGFSYNFIEQKQTLEGTLDNLRPLTRLEEEICFGMIKKIK